MTILFLSSPNGARNRFERRLPGRGTRITGLCSIPKSAEIVYDNPSYGYSLPELLLLLAYRTVVCPRVRIRWKYGTGTLISQVLQGVQHPSTIMPSAKSRCHRPVVAVADGTQISGPKAPPGQGGGRLVTTDRGRSLRRLPLIVSRFTTHPFRSSHRTGWQMAGHLALARIGHLHSTVFAFWESSIRDCVGPYTSSVGA